MSENDPQYDNNGPARLNQLADEGHSFVDRVNPDQADTQMIYLQAAMYRIGAEVVEAINNLRKEVGYVGNMIENLEERWRS